MQASLTFPAEGDLVSGDNPVYIGNVNRGESNTVNWTLVFTSSGVFDLDVNASGYRVDTGEYVESHGFATITVHPHYMDVDVDTAYNMITSGLYPNLLVLDVRTQSEYDSGHLYDAVWIPVSELEARINELASHKDDEMIVYCMSGHRSATASEILYSHNFTKVYNMLGGISSWQSAGYPVWIATVHNLNTTFNYDTIQAAIDASQTLDGHKIIVDAGTYHEHVVVKKTLSLVGENKQTTIIDGNGLETVVRITANNATVAGFTIQNGYSGLISDCCNDSVVSGNLILNNQVCGIDFYRSDNSYVDDNVAADNEYGIRLLGSANNTLRSNILTDNHQNFAIEGELLSEFVHDIDASNVVDGKPIYYLVDQKNKQIPAQAGCVAAINSVNITVRNANLTKNSHGVLLVNTTDSNIENVNASDNSYGIALIWSNDTKVVGNTICFSVSTGIYMYQARGNTIYHNSFIQNWDQIYREESTNTWDDDYPSGGNYWSDYTDVDLFSGTYQNITGSDGIGDEPYDIDEYNRDRYPLTKPYGGPHDVGMVNFTTSKATVVKGQSLNINAKIINYGTNNETFNVTACANQIIVQTKTITLLSRNSTTVTFGWDTTSFEKGEYTVSAQVQPISGETDTTDNMLTNGLVKVIVQGHDVAVKDVMCCKSVVGKGCNVLVNVTAENWGNYTETIDVTLCYTLENSTSFPIETKTITLTIGDCTILTFMWNTTDAAKGNYTLGAYTIPLAGEIDVTDNTITDGWIIVAIIGDITGLEGNPDGKCDIRDVAMIARLYGVNYPDPRYDPNCDLTGPTLGMADGKIDIRDVALVAKNFGKIDP